MLRIISFPASMAVVADATISEIVALKIEQAHAVNLVIKRPGWHYFLGTWWPWSRKLGTASCSLQ